MEVKMKQPSNFFLIIPIVIIVTFLQGAQG